MSSIVKITVDNKTKMEGRLVGFITNEECKAIINSEDAPKKISTSESTTIDQNRNQISGRRFVLVTKSITENNLPAIFISPKIKMITWRLGMPELYCEDKKTYVFENINNTNSEKATTTI